MPDPLTELDKLSQALEASASSPGKPLQVLDLDIEVLPDGDVKLLWSDGTTGFLKYTEFTAERIQLWRDIRPKGAPIQKPVCICIAGRSRYCKAH